MECYQKEKRIEKEYTMRQNSQSEMPQNCRKEITSEDKANIFKQIYSSMELFYRLVRGKSLDTVCAS